jgi:hypothetical protein
MRGSIVKRLGCPTSRQIYSKAVNSAPRFRGDIWGLLIAQIRRYFGSPRGDCGVVWRRDWRRDPERIARRLLSNFEEQIVPTNNSDSRSLDSKARRAAARAGLMAQKSRLRCGPPNDLGGYRLVDPRPQSHCRRRAL